MPMCNLVKNVECQCPPHAHPEIVTSKRYISYHGLNLSRKVNGQSLLDLLLFQREPANSMFVFK